MTITTSAEISPSIHPLDPTGAFVGDDEIGLEVTVPVGIADGNFDCSRLGLDVGLEDGDAEGLEVGLFVVSAVGELVGSEVTGDEVGSDVTGETVGRRDGLLEGACEGHFEGSGLTTHDPNEVVSDDPNAPPLPISTLS